MFVGYVFVDDTDLCIMDPPNQQRPISLIPRIQESLNWWEASCRTTGGAIVPEKSHWYLIDFVWKDGKWKYIEPHPNDTPLTVRNPFGRWEVVERKGPAEAVRTLGIRVAPDGNNKDELAYLLNCAIEWAENIRSKHIPKDLVWLSMVTGIFRKVMWPLVSTCLLYTSDAADE